MAARGGEVPPVHKHFPDAKIEKEGCSLQVGEVSKLIQVQDGTWIILKCDKQLDADATKRIDDERMALSKEIFERKLQMKIPEVFAELRQHANPRILLAGANRPIPLPTPLPGPAVSTNGEKST